MGKNNIPTIGSVTHTTFPIAVTGEKGAPTVVTFIHDHHNASPKLWRAGLMLAS